MDRIDTVMEKMAGNAKEFMIRDGELEPVAMIVDAEAQPRAFPMNTGNEEQKVATYKALRLMCALLSAQAIFTVQEAWSARYDAGQNLEVPPSQREDRMEVVVITGQDFDKPTRVTIYETIRDESGKVVDLRKLDSAHDSVGGRAINFLPVNVTTVDENTEASAAN